MKNVFALCNQTCPPCRSVSGITTIWRFKIRLLLVLLLLLLGSDSECDWARVCSCCRPDIVADTVRSGVNVDCKRLLMKWQSARITSETVDVVTVPHCSQYLHAYSQHELASLVYCQSRVKDPTKTSVSHFGRSVYSCCQTAYCWTSCFFCRWRASGTLFLPTSIQHLLCSLSENV